MSLTIQIWGGSKSPPENELEFLTCSYYYTYFNGVKDKWQFKIIAVLIWLMDPWLWVDK